MTPLTDRLWKYAERHFQRSGKTEFPTVARCARALRKRQAEVAQAVDDCEDLMLTSYFTHPEPPLGEHFVETFER